MSYIVTKGLLLMQDQANDLIWLFIGCILPMFVMFIKVFIVWEFYVLLTHINKFLKRRIEYGR